MLETLIVTQFRNIDALTLSFTPGFNLIIGPNGSGKSSILEAIHYLSCGRSFRSLNHRNIIRFGEEYLSVHGRLSSGDRITVQRFLDGSSKIALNDAPNVTASQLAHCLPVQVITPDSYRLLTDAPNLRRQFLDWGVFHVEPRFHGHWRQAMQALKMRNSALKQRLDRQQVRNWDMVICEHTESVTAWREEMVLSLRDHLQSYLPHFFEGEVELRFYKGWPKDMSFEEALEHAWQHDMETGFSQYGIHRADIKIYYQGKLAKEILSRGQMKSLVLALKLAQGKRISQNLCYLVDDLAAELDTKKRDLMLSCLSDLGAQTIITALDGAVISGFKTQPPSVFHVEHGSCVEAV